MNPSLNRTVSENSIMRPLKILQFGGGNFLRGFVDWMVEILNESTDFNAGIIVVKPTEKGDYHALRNQDGLFHVLTNGIRNGELVSEEKLVTCVQQIIQPYKAWNSFLETAENPDIRFIVSNTTESGIKFNKQDSFPETCPQEFPAKLCAWMYKRWQHFEGRKDKGCIILPCELIENNGDQLRDCLLQYARFWGLEDNFQDWLQTANHYCNSLVDRIVPGYPKERASQIEEKLALRDELLVDAEPYHIWVIEGPEEVKQELPFEQTGLNVVFTDDLQPYRELKVRILNGAHTTVVPVGYLAGIETVREAVEDKEVGEFIRGAIYEEILPTLDFPQDQLEQYAKDVLDRFRNPFIRHQLIDISLNSISKFKTRVLPSLLAYQEKFGRLPQRLVKALAALICFYRGRRGEEKIPLRDSKATLAFFEEIWVNWEKDKDSKQLVQAVLGNEKFWGKELNGVSGLPEKLVQEIEERV